MTNAKLKDLFIRVFTSSFPFLGLRVRLPPAPVCCAAASTQPPSCSNNEYFWIGVNKDNMMLDATRNGESCLLPPYYPQLDSDPLRDIAFRVMLS